MTMTVANKTSASTNGRERMINHIFHVRCGGGPGGCWLSDIAWSSRSAMLGAMLGAMPAASRQPAG